MVLLLPEVLNEKQQQDLTEVSELFVGGEGSVGEGLVGDRLGHEGGVREVDAETLVDCADLVRVVSESRVGANLICGAYLIFFLVRSDRRGGGGVWI
jgi:hypothetical protein